MAFTLGSFTADTTLTPGPGQIPAFAASTTLTPITRMPAFVADTTLTPAMRVPAFTADSTLTPGPGRASRFVVGGDGPSTSSYTPTGGVQISGVAVRTFVLNGVTVNDPVTYTIVGSGGVQISGSATVSSISLNIWQDYPNGGVKIGGAAIVATNWLEFHPTPSGVKIGGAALIPAIVVGSGGVQISGSAFIGTVTGDLAGTLPRVTADFEGETTAVLTGDLSATLPSMTGDFEAVGGMLAGLAGVLPKVTATMAGGSASLAGKLPSLTAALSGYAGVIGSMDAQLPRITASMAGIPTITGGLSAQLPHVSGAFVGLAGVIGDLAATLGEIACSASGAVGVRATLSGVLPSMQGDFAAFALIQASMSLTLPRISPSMTAQHVDQLLMTFVTNTLTSAGTTFSDYPFNSFAEFGGKYYGAGPNGLHQLDVPQNDIPWHMSTGYLELGSTQQKRASDFYMVMHSVGDITLNVSVDEGPQYSYRLSPNGIPRLSQRRVALGKGLRGVQWQFDLSGTKDFDFDNYTVAVAPTVRRV